MLRATAGRSPIDPAATSHAIDRSKGMFTTSMTFKVSSASVAPKLLYRFLLHFLIRPQAHQDTNSVCFTMLCTTFFYFNGIML
jgi:hypothetical protein